MKRKNSNNPLKYDPDSIASAPSISRLPSTAGVELLA